MINIGNGNIFEVVDVDNGKEIENKEDFDRICKEGRAALMIDMEDTKYPVLITFFDDHPETPYTIHVMYGPLPLEQEKKLLQKLRGIKGLKSIRSPKSIRITPKLVKGFLEFIQKR